RSRSNQNAMAAFDVARQDRFAGSHTVTIVVSVRAQVRCRIASLTTKLDARSAPVGVGLTYGQVCRRSSYAIFLTVDEPQIRDSRDAPVSAVPAVQSGVDVRRTHVAGDLVRRMMRSPLGVDRQSDSWRWTCCAFQAANARQIVQVAMDLPSDPVVAD